MGSADGGRQRRHLRTSSCLGVGGAGRRCRYCWPSGETSGRHQPNQEPAVVEVRSVCRAISGTAALSMTSAITPATSPRDEAGTGRAQATGRAGTRTTEEGVAPGLSSGNHRATAVETRRSRPGRINRVHRHGQLRRSG